MRGTYCAVEGDMAASLICGRLTASLRNSGARNTLGSASKVSVRPRGSEALRPRQVSARACAVFEDGNTDRSELTGSSLTFIEFRCFG